MSEQPTATSVVSSSPLIVRAVLRTDVGRVRSENQDSGSVTPLSGPEGVRPGGRLLIVADGMGGHRGGATASRLATETVQSQYLGSATDDIALALGEALARANSRIFSEAQANADLRGMGTTTSALAVRGQQAWFAHVGDSRIYMIRGDEIRQWTEDHSLVATMVKEGLLTSKEAEHHPRRNVLQRSMGVSEEVDIDVRGPYELLEYDTFVLCSDGLHGPVKPEEIKDIVLKAASIADAADEMVRLALERGGPDNVTVIVARMERADQADGVLYDETLREDAKEGLASEATPARPMPAMEPKAPPETINLSSEPGPATSVEAPPAGRRRTSIVLKWAVIFVIVLGVAGAWLFLHQQQMFQTRSATTSK